MNGLKIIAGLGAALILTACGSGQGGAGSASSTSPASASGTASTGGTGGSNSGGTPAGAGHKVKKGTISGTLVMIGGAIGAGNQQPTPKPVPGTVMFTSLRHGSFTVQVGSSGGFSMKLPVGSYHLSGRSPKVTANGSESVCTRPAAVNVGVDDDVRVSVTCIVP